MTDHNDSSTVTGGRIKELPTPRCHWPREPNSGNFPRCHINYTLIDFLVPLHSCLYARARTTRTAYEKALAQS